MPSTKELPCYLTEDRLMKLSYESINLYEPWRLSGRKGRRHKDPKTPRIRR